mgnify:FL=1
MYNKSNPHYPLGMKVDVNENEVEEHQAKGFVTLTNQIIVPADDKQEEKPDLSWTEKKIKKWISDQGYDVKYDIGNDSKVEALSRLRSKGYL